MGLHRTAMMAMALAVANAMATAEIERYGEWNWGRCSDEFKRMKLKEAKAELAAGIKAWPGVVQDRRPEYGRHFRIILPLTQENNSAKS